MEIKIIDKTSVANTSLKLEIDLRVDRDQIVINNKTCEKLGVQHGDFIGFGKDGDSQTIFVFKVTDENKKDFFELKRFNSNSPNLFVQAKDLLKTLGVQESVILPFNKKGSQPTDGIIKYFAFSPSSVLINDSLTNVERRRNSMLAAIKAGKTKAEIREAYNNNPVFYADWNHLVMLKKITDDKARTRTTGAFLKQANQ